MSRSSKVKFVILLALIAFLAGMMLIVAITGSAPFSGSQDNDPSSTRKLTGDEAKELYNSAEDAILLDVRNQDEYDEGHIEGSVLIPVSELASRLSELPDKDALIIVFCRTGVRSAEACGILKENGYRNAFDMQRASNWPDPLVP